jgi:hypothetical protein
MDNEQIESVMKSYPARMGAIHRRISVAARAVVPVLKDAGRTNSAAELDQLFFELDALDQEMKDFVAEDPARFVDGLIRMMEGRR